MLLVSHLGRFYGDVPLALAMCFEENQQALPAAGSGHNVAHDQIGASHHHSHSSSAHATASAPDSSPDPGFQLEHCRDTWNGMNLIPSTVLSPPTAVVSIAPAVPGMLIEFRASRNIPEITHAIFHPPQLLS